MAFIDRFEHEVSRVCRSQGLAGFDLDCAVQETWIRAYERRSTLRRPETFAAWISTIARHEALRIAKRHHHPRLPRIQDDLEAKPAATALDRLLGEEAIERVRAVLQDLPLEQRRIAEEFIRAPDASHRSRASRLGKPWGTYSAIWKGLVESIRRRWSRD